MHIVRSIKETQEHIQQVKAKQQTIGFVPTMGYLHDGHLSLVRLAKQQCEHVTVSIFVNPTQFGPNEDLEAYPRDEERDLGLLQQEGVNTVFIPEYHEIYPPDFSTYIQPPSQSEGWCGASRPIHFRGVCTVVSILFNIVQPTHAIFGQKDAQQAAVIRQMTQDLHFPITILTGDIIREKDGLAMSSRNVYLSPEERKKALILHNTLQNALSQYRSGLCDAGAIIEEGKQRITAMDGVQLDYLGIVDQNTFKSIDTILEGNIILGAIYVGKTRLIDNEIFTEE